MFFAYFLIFFLTFLISLSSGLEILRFFDIKVEEEKEAEEEATAEEKITEIFKISFKFSSEHDLLTCIFLLFANKGFDKRYK